MRTVQHRRMTVVIFCLEMLILMSHMVSAFPQGSMDELGRECKRCPPGHYRSECTVCSPCASGYYTSEMNTEDHCHPCNRDCRKEFNLQVDKECSSESDVVCSCMVGFTCQDPINSANGQCKYCVKTTTPTSQPVVVKTKNCSPGMLFNQSSGNCDPKSSNQIQTDVKSTQKPDTEGRQLWWYAVSAVFVGIALVMIGILIIRWNRDGACLKQLCKMCSQDAHKGENDTTAHQPGETSGQLFSKEKHWKPNSLTNHNTESHNDVPISIDQAPKATGNLGPFHIYNAGAVFVSLLNHFANPEKETEGGRRPEKEGEMGECSPNTPPPSTPVHLSEEERDNGEKDCIFFPSQEQGKESHLSKEEEM
ncbi:hypothetical protein AGOR_G00207510 [Albula goreensis]|uniref:TNFR-Cys domain-containing protein n=1 Tax=Albula goreensis TaxID=1534307 RepID=A0A8T3CKX5_9TELE|nr:hypothetical protein AGOR_G00207510 [Albula goreensis]